MIVAAIGELFVALGTAAIATASEPRVLYRDSEPISTVPLAVLFYVWRTGPATASQYPN